jgi:hypothetical protein
MGRNSGTSREVDVSLRSQVGSVSVLVIIECRDRAKPQDVTWIEPAAELGGQQPVDVQAGLPVREPGGAGGDDSGGQGAPVIDPSAQFVDDRYVGIRWCHIHDVPVRVIGAARFLRNRLQLADLGLRSVRL